MIEKKNHILIRNIKPQLKMTGNTKKFHFWTKNMICPRHRFFFLLNYFTLEPKSATLFWCKLKLTPYYEVLLIRDKCAIQRNNIRHLVVNAQHYYSRHTYAKYSTLSWIIEANFVKLVSKATIVRVLLKLLISKLAERFKSKRNSEIDY